MKRSNLIKKCQMCGSRDLNSVLFLGYLPPVNHLQSLNSSPRENTFFPLELVRCGNCELVQINLEINKEVLFPYSYPYLSGTTKILMDNFYDLFNEVKRMKLLVKNDLVVDIGSNDGSLLKNFNENGYNVLGVEPSKAYKEALKKGVKTLNSYFTDSVVSKIIKQNKKAKVVTAANVFAHISNPQKLVKLIKKLLDKNGIFISESHYLPSLIKTLQYDTIYHEHLRYYHVGVLKKLFEKNGLYIFKVKKIPTHGGSIRVYASKSKNVNVQANVLKILDEEKKAGVCDGSVLYNFKSKIIISKLELMKLLLQLKKNNHKIYGIGAPSRASTFISYTGIDDGIIDCVLEVGSSHKLNKFMPGTKIPILDEKKLFTDNPSYVLLLSWHISDGLIRNLKKKGYKGKFIIPLPKPKILK